MSKETEQFKDIEGHRGLALQARFEGNLAIAGYSMLWGVAGVVGMAWTLFVSKTKPVISLFLTVLSGAGIG